LSNCTPTLLTEQALAARFDLDERLIAAGEQARKRRIVTAPNVTRWGDFFTGEGIRFAAFLPPGRYRSTRPWGNELRRMDHFEKAILRRVESPAGGGQLHELELVFSSGSRPGITRFLVSGFDAAALPQLAVADYSKGLYMPMGIAVPPFGQDYPDLEKSSPQQSPYFSLLLDGDDRWINHHRVGIDGPVIHRDASDPNLLHLYLLSYERETLLAHFLVPLPAMPLPAM
jgi:hypothetical protein